MRPLPIIIAAAALIEPTAWAAPALEPLTTTTTTTRTRAEVPQADVHSSERWAMAAAASFGPLEPFPRFGVALEGHYRWSRWRFGGALTFYPASTSGNVARSAWRLEPTAQLLALESDYVDWSFAFGLGVAWFHDDYLAVYPDVSRVAPGFTLGTAIEVRATELLRPFVGLRVVSYFAEDVADDKWLELSVGARLAFGHDDAP